MSRRIQLKVHVSKRPIPLQSWLPELGWGMTLYTLQGAKLRRHAGATYAEAAKERDKAMATGAYEKSWLWQITRPLQKG